MTQNEISKARKLIIDTYGYVVRGKNVMDMGQGQLYYISNYIRSHNIKPLPKKEETVAVEKKPEYHQITLAEYMGGNIQ